MMREILGATSLQIVSHALAIGDRFVLSALMLRAWGIGVFEDWTVLLAAAGMFGMLDLGLNATYSNAFMHAYQKGDINGFRRHVSTALFINSAILLLGAAGFIAWSTFGVPLSKIALGHLDSGTGSVVFALLLVSTLIQTATGALTPIYRAQGQFRRGLKIDLVLSAIRLIAVAASVVAGGGQEVTAAVYLFTTAAWALLLLPLDLRWNLDNVPIKASAPTASEAVEITSVAPWFFLQRATDILLQGVPLLVLAEVSEEAGAVAMFLFVRQLFNFMRQLTFSLSNSIGIVLSQTSASTSDSGLVQSHLLRATRFVCVLSGTALAGLLVVADPMFAIWSGDSVTVDKRLLAILGTSFVLTAPFTPVSTYLIYMGNARIGAAAKLISVGLAVIAGGLLARTWGLAGIAMALAVGEIVGFGSVYLRSAAVATGQRVTTLVVRWARYILIGLVPTAAAGLVVRFLIDAAPLGTIIATGFGMLPVSLLLLFRFGTDDSARSAVTSKLDRLRTSPQAR